MALTKEQKQSVQETITASLRKKFLNYKPESTHMPFHFRLLGRDRMALYSFIQSLNTTFGTSIFEPVAVVLSKNHFTRVESQYAVENAIFDGCQHTIQTIMNELTVGTTPDKKKNLKCCETHSQAINKHCAL